MDKRKEIQNYDVAIIGGGPGGYVAAIRAAQLGMNTALIEEKHLGGICLNWGCIPTKTLLRTAEIYRLSQEADRFGLDVDVRGFDTEKVIKRSRDVAAKLNSGVEFLLKKNKVHYYPARAVLKEKGIISLREKGGEELHISAGHRIIATGASPRMHPIFKDSPQEETALMDTYFEAMVPKSIPESILIIGAGAIGVEFASFYNAMGSNVVLVEMLPRILPAEDAEIIDFVHKKLVRRGIKVKTESSLEKISKTTHGIIATLKDKSGQEEVHKFNKALSAIGVEGNIKEIGLEALGVICEKGCIITDGFGRTNINGIYAIGDVTGPPMLAHKAEHEGIICIEAIAGLKPKPLMRERIPACTFCEPQIASVGLTEKAAQEKYQKIKVGNFPFAGNGKALALGEDQGMIKVIFDAQRGQLLGAHLVGAEVTELINSFALAMTLETTEEELMHTVFPHPTLSEMIHEATLDAYGRAIHK